MKSEFDSFSSTRTWNLLRTRKDRYWKSWYWKVAVFIALVAIIGSFSRTFLAAIRNAQSHRLSKTHLVSKSPKQTNTIPTSTIVQPVNGSTLPIIEPSSTTLTTTIHVSCPAAVSITARGVSNGTNTLTVDPPGAEAAHSTGPTPSVSTYSPQSGIWNLTDVSNGSSTTIQWSANGAACTTG